ncbi:MAG: hypothetical protein ABG776_07640 [Cyanobacteria bacterium J06555_13]
MKAWPEAAEEIWPKFGLEDGAPMSWIIEVSDSRMGLLGYR